MGGESALVVRGQVVVPADVRAAETASLIVSVEDVSRADAPSLVIGEQRQEGVQLTAGAILPFQVEVPKELVDARHSYSVRAHLDLSGSGTVEIGDLVSTQSYPVLTRGHSDEATIEVKRV
jgi:uncharacterized lipoprotein YbaY